MTPSLPMFQIDQYFAGYWQAVRGAKDRLDVPAGFPNTFRKMASCALWRA